MMNMAAMVARKVTNSFFTSASTREEGHNPRNHEEEGEEKQTEAKADPERRKNPHPRPCDVVCQLEHNEDDGENAGQTQTTRAGAAF